MKLPHPFLTVLAILALAAPAPAQQVVYADGFENGLTDWVATGLWNLEDETDSCGAAVAPFAEGSKAAWYGSASTCNFDTGGTNSGTLTSTNWIQLPDSPSISLHFWMWQHTEFCFADSYYNLYDVSSVVISRETGSSITQTLCITNNLASTVLPWHERRIDISAFRNLRVKISFQFGTGDQLSNGYLGWLVDDVQILAEPGERVCPLTGFNSICPCQLPYVPVAGGCRNSTSQSATLFSSGVASVSADTVRFRVEHMPPNASSILTQATGTGTPIVFNDGVRCISGQLRRMGSVAAQQGVAEWPPVGTDPIAIRGAIPPSGGTRYYYVYYRDVQNYCTPATANLTDTQRIVWVP